MAGLRAKAAELRELCSGARCPAARPPDGGGGQDALPRLHLALALHHFTGEGLAGFIERFRVLKQYRDLLIEMAELRPRLERLAPSSCGPARS